MVQCSVKVTGDCNRGRNLNGFLVARPELDLMSGACGNDCERRSPTARTDDRDPLHENFGSVPFISLLMFPRCAKIINSATTNAAVSGAFCNQRNSGIDPPAQSDATDPYLVTPTTATKTMPAHNRANGASTKNTPTAVATPFPPRNPSHTGKM